MGTHPIFESDFDCLTDMSNDIDYRKLIAQGNELKEKLTEGSRFDLIKGVGFGYLLGRYRAAPVVIGFGVGCVVDSYVRIPNVRQKVEYAIAYVKKFSEK